MFSICNSVSVYHGVLNFVQEIKIKDVIHLREYFAESGACNLGYRLLQGGYSCT
jgi:hypothetical protein